jgi:hypothetical protein
LASHGKDRDLVMDVSTRGLASFEPVVCCAARCGRPYTYPHLPGGVLMLTPVPLAASLTTLAGHVVEQGPPPSSPSPLVELLEVVGELWFFAGAGPPTGCVACRWTAPTGLWSHSAGAMPRAGGGGIRGHACDRHCGGGSMRSGGGRAVAVVVHAGRRDRNHLGSWLLLLAVGQVSFHHPVMIQSWMMMNARDPARRDPSLRSRLF